MEMKGQAAGYDDRTSFRISNMLELKVGDNRISRRPNVPERSYRLKIAADRK